MEPMNPAYSADGGETGEEEEEEFDVEIAVTEDNRVLLIGPDFELLLAPDQARLLGQALLDTANDAESGEDSDQP